MIGPFYRRLSRRRRDDRSRTISSSSTANRYSHDFSIFDEVWPNTVYTVHDYAPPGLIEGGGYPGVTHGQYFDRSVVEATFAARTEFLRRTGTPLYVGEFVDRNEEAADGQRLQLLADQLDIYRQAGAGWNIWTYKDIGLQGLVRVHPESPYMERIREVVTKKARLGADNWDRSTTAFARSWSRSSDSSSASSRAGSRSRWGRTSIGRTGWSGIS